MRILVTNDDGIHAEGLKVLEAIARELTDDVWVVAPETDQSGKSHSLTLTEPIRLRYIDTQHIAIRGTPTDCVIMGVKHILDRAPDLVLSGVNRGSNAADDVTYSGTIAAAMEGTILGIPSIALSQTYAREVSPDPNWDCARAHGAGVIRKLLEAGMTPGTLMNINFPACGPEEVTGVEVTSQGESAGMNVVVDQRIDVRGYPYYWISFHGKPAEHMAPSDLWALKKNAVSVTPIRLNLTDQAARDRLKHVFR
jgi:5'-nucleotidase